MPSSRKELFEQAKRQRHLDKQNENQGNFGGYEEVNWTALEEEQFSILRLLGNPLTQRMDDPTSGKQIDISMILGDNDKKFRCIWPLKSVEPNWIMRRILGKVLDGKWNKESKSMDYYNVNRHPSIFQRVLNNSNPSNPYEKGWRPKSVVIMNVIDRLRMDWHRENKHTFLLSKKMSTTDNNVYYETGFPFYLWKKIFDDVVEYAGDFQDYDIAVTKLGEDPWYKVYHADDDYKKIQSSLQGVDTATFTAPLTEEELNWERYDVDKLFKVTSYQKLLNRLKSFIDSVDKAFGTHYLEELTDLAEEEKKANADTEGEGSGKDRTPAETTKDVWPEDNKEEEAEQNPKNDATEPPPIRRATRQAKTPESETAVDFSVVESVFPGVKKFNAEEKAQIVGVKDDGGLVWDSKVGQLFACPNESCGVLAPGSVSCCPKCGQEFE